MNFVSLIMVFFSILGAIDRIIGNRFGLGKEFEKGVMVIGSLALSMIGMIVIAPFIADILSPVIELLVRYTPIDPSIIPSLLFANDMGGAPLAKEISSNSQFGYFNGLVIASMMGATISFTIPFSLEVVKKEQHKKMLTGILCGIITIPFGCFAAGIIAKLPIIPLLINTVPLIIFSVLISWGLLKFPDVCVKIFMCLGIFIKIIITTGLAIGILKFLTGIEIIKGLTSYEEAGMVILNAMAILTGAFPMVYILSKVLAKPLTAIGRKLKINEISAMGLLSTLATNITTFDTMKDMDDKGVVINSAFAVPAAFVFADHLAFTLAFNQDYLFPVIAGKLLSGILAIVLALFIYNKTK